MKRKPFNIIKWVEALWYQMHPLRWLLWPLSWVYAAIVRVRRLIIECFFQKKLSVPVIVVGNITVGGVGKTPLVIALAKTFLEKGLRVGIVSRGYGATVKRFPYEVSPQADAKKVGDEPRLLAITTGCPVVIAPKRVDAAQFLIDNHQVQLIISDDGLQHYAMGRAIEIAVLDGVRGLGNGMLLPAGPLRERPQRLEQVDFVVVNGGADNDAYAMALSPGKLRKLTCDTEVNLTALIEPIIAIAAIGNPQRFFTTLADLGLSFKSQTFPDHHDFVAEELTFSEKSILMTEKDAVKCHAFATDAMYYLPVEARLGEDFWQALFAHQQLKAVLKE